MWFCLHGLIFHRGFASPCVSVLSTNLCFVFYFILLIYQNQYQPIKNRFLSAFPTNPLSCKYHNQISIWFCCQYSYGSFLWLGFPLTLRCWVAISLPNFRASGQPQQQLQYLTHLSLLLTDCCHSSRCFGLGFLHMSSVYIGSAIFFIR